MLSLSVLDQCPVPAGSTPSQALEASLDLAVAAEALGYRRYWAAEHHNTPSLASVSPEVLVAAVAARTRSIRVGSGGVLLSHYSPLKVAENFRLLEALHPGRIDLGIGRTAGTDPVTEAALQYRPDALGDEHFGQKVADLLAFLDGDLGRDHPYAGVTAVPPGPGGPEVWVLGSSSNGAAGAAYLGLPFAFGHFITAQFGPQIVKSYRKGFTASARLARPQASVAVSVVCAETDGEAERLATSAAVWRLRPEGSSRGPLLPPDEAARASLSEVDQAKVHQHRAGIVAGNPDRARRQLTDLAATFGVEELVVVTVCHDPRARLRSYELLAEAFELPRG
ncbi:MAG: LLM class flavin-dependent oxidoreductase [Acidimicrobiales bacterium]